MIRALILATLFAATLQREFPFASESLKGLLAVKNNSDAIEIIQWQYTINDGQATAVILYPSEYTCSNNVQNVKPVLLSVEVLTDEFPASVKIDPDLRRAVIHRVKPEDGYLNEALVIVNAYCLKYTTPREESIDLLPIANHADVE